MKNNKHQRKQQKVRYPVNLFCEGSQEEKYFEHLKNLINNSGYNKKSVVVNPYNVGGGAPNVIVNTAIRLCPATQTPCAVFDHDLKSEAFNDALDISIRNKIDYGYSNLNFDYWLVLHKTQKPSTALVTKTDAYVDQLKKLYSLDANDDIKNEKVIEKIVNQITLPDIYNAIANCEKICKFNKDKKVLINTPNGNGYYDNPDFSIHKVISKVLNDTLL